MASYTDTVDVAEAARALRRGWRFVAYGVLGGLLLAGAVVLFVPPRFDGVASIVLRESGGGGSSLLARLSGGAGAVPQMLGLGGSGSSLKTEVEVLQSRELVGRVVDSLGLQVRIVSPRGLPAGAILSSVELPGEFKRRTYAVERVQEGVYRLESEEDTVRAAVGTPARLAVGRVTLRADAAIPASLELQLFDREDAITRTMKGLRVSAPGGDVIEAKFGARDSATAASVPNALMAEYVAWRQGTDRGVNRHRVQFLTAQSDSVAAQLARAAHELRRFQEASGVMDPSTVGRLQLEQAGELRKEIGTLEAEQGALDQLLAQVVSGSMSARQLAAYPTFLRSPAINQILAQIATLETQRTALLERRLESDRTVEVLDRSIADLEGQLVPLATAYRSSIARQRADMTQQFDTLRNFLETMPATTEAATLLQRDVLRLGQIHTALQAQLVEARLAAVGEGGDIRRLDVARPSKEPAFPKPAVTLAAGAGGGLVIGLVLALFAGLLGRWVEDPRAIERMAGVPALRLDTSMPLLVAGTPATTTILLVPIDERTTTNGVAQRLARTALARGSQPTVLDLSGGVLPVSTEGGAASVYGTVERMERESGMLIVQLPGLSHDTTIATLNERRPVLLVAPAGRVDRENLTAAVETLRRLEVPCAGVVLNRTGDALASA